MSEKKKDRAAETDYTGVHTHLYRRLAETGRDGWSSPDDVRVMTDQVQRACRSPGFPRHGRMLELGCGDGCFTIPAAGAFDYRVTGIDIVPMAVNRARQRAESAGVQTTLTAGSVLDLPFPDRRFDLALDSHCLHCIIGRDRNRFLAEASRVLKSKGVLLVMTMAGRPPENMVPHYDPDTRCEIVNDKAVRYYGRPKDIVEEVRAAGFEIIDHWLLPAKDEKDVDELIAVAVKPG